MHRELPVRPDLDYYRKDAKALARGHRLGETQAIVRAERVLGERARRRFVLSDAQYVLAAEHGYRSWAELKRDVKRARAGTSPAEDPRLTAMRGVLAEAARSWGDVGEVGLDAGMRYGGGEPIRITVRKRLHRYDIDDQGGAVREAGRPAGWFEVAEEIAREEGLNVSRQGVVFVPAVEGRDLAQLAWRIAAMSLTLYEEVLELRG